LAVGEHHITSNGVSERIDGLGGFGRGMVGMDSHIAEVSPKAWLEEPARCRIERLASRTEHLMHSRGSLMCDWPGRLGLQYIWLVVLLAGTFAAESRVRIGQRKSAVRHTHNLVGHAVSLLFERVVDRSDFEVRRCPRSDDRHRASAVLAGSASDSSARRR
jgi:hypothetical protein